MHVITIIDVHPRVRPRNHRSIIACTCGGTVSDVFSFEAKKVADWHAKEWHPTDAFKIVRIS